MPRSIKTIAQDIKKDWTKVSPYAKPYLDAMLALESITDYYYFDPAKEIVLYFLANAQGWRGETAKKIKQELKDLCK